MGKEQLAVAVSRVSAGNGLLDNSRSNREVPETVGDLKISDWELRKNI
jgi:hypothetical protein